MTNGVSRFLGGPPLAVALRLLLLCLLVGIILSALGFEPGNIVGSLRRVVESIWNMGWDAVRAVGTYLLLGAIVVIPIWLLVRFMRAPRS
jgi:hypothetical protein